MYKKLADIGLDYLQHAENMIVKELKELLQAPLEDCGASPFHVARIIKSLHFVGSRECDNVLSPTLLSPTLACTLRTSATTKEPEIWSGIPIDVEDDADCQPQLQLETFKIPDHYDTWSDVTVAVHTLACSKTKRQPCPSPQP